jgi:hypothetical protein
MVRTIDGDPLVVAVDMPSDWYALVQDPLTREVRSPFVARPAVTQPL